MALVLDVRFTKARIQYLAGIEAGGLKYCTKFSMLLAHGQVVCCLIA